MITEAARRKLRAVRAPGPSVPSLYVRVPVDLPALRGLPARADELLAEAAAGMDGEHVVRARAEERRMVYRLLEVHARRMPAWSRGRTSCPRPA